MAPPKKFLSLLSVNTANYEDLIKSFQQKGFNGFHFDIMDGHFVKNFAFGPNIIKTLRKVTDLPFQAHLEIENPGEYIDLFIDSGCQIITIHPQTCNMERELRYMRTRKIITSVAIDPEIEVDIVKGYLNLIDNIIVMAVYPGFGGQDFDERALEKIVTLKELIKENNFDITISVDGGVSNLTENKLLESGADILIYGSSLFK